MITAGLTDLVATAGRTQANCEYAHLPGRPIRLFGARPEQCTSRTPILLVHHGDLRNGAQFRDFWLPLVDRFDLLVIVPEFSEAAFPGTAWYSLGNRCNENERANPREQWTYGIPKRIFEALRNQGITSNSSYAQFGHSSGAQFVHRSMSLGFRDSVAAAVTANAGTYAMPDLAVAFPYGLGELGMDERLLRDLLGFPLAIFAGTADVDITSPHFPKDEPAMRQGPTRYARAHAYLAKARRSADRLVVPCRWSIIDVPGVGHEGGPMSTAAAPFLSAALHQSRA